MPVTRVLVAEDDDAIRRGLTDALRFGGYEVIECADGASALATALGATPDLVLLDVMLPAMNGFDVLDQLRRARPSLPVILVTARGGEDDRVHGLRHGADDYVVKPFSAREVLARVEAVLRRSPGRPGDVGTISHAGIIVNVPRREVSAHGATAVALSEKETEILRYLAVRRGRTVSRDELLRNVWGLDPRGLETRTVDMHVVRLREKLTSPGVECDLIVTVRGAGYMLAESAEVTAP